MERSINYGDTIVWNGKTTKCNGKYAQGVWYTYTFQDGRSFNGNPEPMFASGELVAVGVAAPATQPPVSHKHWQAPMSHPTQKEEKDGKAAQS